MKHLNCYKIFENKEDIDAICNKYNIKNYTINDDGSIDVDGNVDLRKKGLTEIPLKFNRVSGDFTCNLNPELKSLKNCPVYVGKYFNCSDCNLTSFEYSPKYIGSCFYCYDNKLTSLEWFPEYVHGLIQCHNNPIFSVVRYFISRDDSDNLIELFNYYDIIQDMDVIYDRLKFFYDGILSSDWFEDANGPSLYSILLNNIKKDGYNIIK